MQQLLYELHSAPLLQLKLIHLWKYPAAPCKKQAYAAAARHMSETECAKRSARILQMHWELANPAARLQQLLAHPALPHVNQLQHMPKHNRLGRWQLSQHDSSCHVQKW